MITIYQEITDWEYPNGIYHVNGSGELVAYQPEGGELKEFSVPIRRFSKSRRKFKTIGTRPEAVSDAIEVQGSNGNTYYIKDGRCTCPGFKFRGNCKHVRNLK